MEQDAHAFTPVDMDIPGMSGNPEELLSFNDGTTSHNSHNLDKANISWLEELNRDPFGTHNDGSLGGSLGEANKAADPHLDAIFSGENTHMAVVDQQLVREGDKIRGYRVIAIKRTQVILRRNGEQLTLEAHL